MKLLRILHHAVIIYLPVICFVVMFISFILQVFSRYVLTSAWIWPFEVTVLGFIWTVMFGACYALYRRDMIDFPVIYELLSDRWQKVLTIIGNLAIAVLLSISILPVYNALSFLYIQKSSILRIPFDIFFAPFLFTLIYYLGHSVYVIITTLRDWKINSTSEQEGAVD